MNYREISFTTAATAISAVNPLVELDDLTTVAFVLSGITEEFTPTTMTISWGDGSVNNFDNSVFKNYREVSIFGEVLYGNFSSLFAVDYLHSYAPSVSARFKSLSAEIMIEYSNGDVTSIIQPLRVLSEDYYETIGDVTLINTNILPLSSNPKQHMLVAEIDGYLIETESS